MKVMWKQHLSPVAIEEQKSCNECLQPLLGIIVAQVSYNHQEAKAAAN